MELHLAIEPLKQNPVEIKIYKNDTFLQEAFIDKLGWLTVKKIPLSQKENEFILRFEIKNNTDKKIKELL